MALYKRIEGGEQPCWPILGGYFKVRLPFVHYSWSWQDCLQGMVLAATGLAAIPVIQSMGIPTEICIVMVFISSCLYLLHVLLGDPVVPGWITPGIPLVLAWLAPIAMEQRVDYVIAAQLTLAVIFLVLGTTGIAEKFVNWLPNSIKGGIIMGAGFASVVGEFAAKGRFHKFPYSITAAVLVAFFILYSKKGSILKSESPLFAKITTLGIVPGVAAAAIVGTITGEVKWQAIKWGFSFSGAEFGRLVSDWSVFGRGLPPLEYFIGSIGIVITLYVIAYGDLITGRAIIKEADELRTDEVIDINANRVNFMCGIRNLVLGSISPYPVFHGPIWGGAHVATVERYKLGRKAMDSIFDGAGFFYIGATIALCLAPFVSILQPLLPIALSLTMIMQGWVCGYVSVNMAKSNSDLGMMGVMAAVLATAGATVGLITGVVLYLLLFTGKIKNKVLVGKSASN